ncbi:SMI1/KNR4 family protein (plasmid) [Bacillus carboniphilus]|uniref:SMI1/KNR4 family protein n=1 Tax=Bacillus carboniphilus TaxID=86663 RepID=A0ABY9K175_9BACI|nr:SMI1/KNR4 family protein [Bacillus carboniphilus]WLR44458.1 SMI1/KNR4 family protein [Bacillus carboniphilus]
MNSYKKAKKIILNDEDLSDFVGSRSEELIEKAEKVLNISITGSYRDFLLSFGAGNYGSQEIYGVIDDDFENSSVPDAIWYTLSERKECNLPENLLVIYDTGSGDLFCLDFDKKNLENEPEVISFVPGVDLNKQKYEVIAPTFGQFLLEIINQELE